MVEPGRYHHSSVMMTYGDYHHPPDHTGLSGVFDAAFSSAAAASSSANNNNNNSASRRLYGYDHPVQVRSKQRLL